MPTNEYRTNRPRKHGQWIDLYKFFGALGFILLILAFVERSKGTLITALIFLGLAVLVYKMVRRDISTEELNSYGSKTLEPIKHDQEIPILNEFEIKFGAPSLGGFFGSAVWTATVTGFAVFVQNKEDGPMMVLYSFIGVGILITWGALNGYFKEKKHLEKFPKAKILLDAHAIRIPEILVHGMTDYASSHRVIPWSEIVEWSVHDGDDSFDYYRIKTIGNNYPLTIYRKAVVNEVFFLDSVRKIGNQKIILKTDVEQK
jgi:hypothetical protein